MYGHLPSAQSAVAHAGSRMRAQPRGRTRRTGMHARRHACMRGGTPAQSCDAASASSLRHASSMVASDLQKAKRT